MAVCACAGPLTAPAAAQTVEDPGWPLVESPGAAGLRFGLGIDLRWDDLDNLLNAADTTIVTLRDAQGNASTQVVAGDPALNNRKFDYRFERRGAGGQVPVALPRFGLGPRVTAYPSLVVEAAVTEVTFEFHDRTNPQDSTSIAGRGVSYGLGLEAVAALGRAHRWFLGAGYRFQGLPSLDLERSPSLDTGDGTVPGGNFEVTRNQVELSQDTHLGTLRLGRTFRGGRVAPYLGLRGRWTDLEIEDRSGLRSPLGIETDLSTHLRFESDSTLGVVGADAELGRSLAGRAEVTFGEGDVAILLKTVLRLNPRTSQGRGATEPIVRELERLRDELSREADGLEPLRAAQPQLYAARVLDLLTRIESEAVVVLLQHDYVALADWLRDRFEEARAAAGNAQEPRVESMSVYGYRGTVKLASLRGPGMPAQPDGGDENGQEEGWFARALHALSLIIVRAQENCLKLKVGFRVLDLDGAEIAMTYVWVHLRNVTDPHEGTEIQANVKDGEQEIRIGSYSFRITTPEPGAYGCGSDIPEPVRQCPLDLVRNPVGNVNCQLETGDHMKCTYGERYRSCSDAR